MEDVPPRRPEHDSALPLRARLLNGAVERLPVRTRGAARLALFRARERRLARTGFDAELGYDHLPLPPPRMRVLVAGHADADEFVRQGLAFAEIIRAALARAGAPIEGMD